MKFPEKLKYTEDHEWVSIKGNRATIGITDFAQRELGDIVYVEVDAINERIGKGEIFGTVEAVKTVSDLLMPLSGKVVEFNTKLNAQPELVNQDPYGEGWVIKAELENIDTLGLLNSEEYLSKIS